MKHKRSLWLIVLLILLMILPVFTACSRTLYITDYIHVEFSGYDGYGNAYAYFDKESFIGDNEKLSFKKTDDADLSVAAMWYDSAAECVADLIYCGLDYSSGLSNGDEVVPIVDYDAYTIKELTGCDIAYNSSVFTVEGLASIPTFDAFSLFQVSFAGFEPYGQAIIDCSDGRIDFTVDRSENLSNNDTITVSLTNIDHDYFINNYGGVPEATEKQYTVSGLETYVTELSQIPSDVIDSVNAQSKDYMTAYAAQNWSEKAKLQSVTPIGCYMLLSKGGDDSIPVNCLYFVYSINAWAPGADRNVDYYWYTMFTDVTVTTDGSVSIDPLEAVACDNTCYMDDDDDYYYMGYGDIGSMFHDLITSRLDAYTYESNVKDTLRIEDPSAAPVGYMTSPDQIPEQLMERIDGISMEHFTKKWSTWGGLYDDGDDNKCLDKTLLGNYFLTPKGGSGESSNILILVYEIKANDTMVGDFTYYFHTMITDLEVLPDGNISAKLNSISIPKESFSHDTSHSGFSYYGYETLDELIKDQITARIDMYEYVTTVK